MVRKILNFLIILSPVIGISAFYAGMIDHFALFSFFVFGPVLLLMPRWLIGKRQLQDGFNQSASDFLEIFAITVFAINSFGAIYAFKNIPNYDSAAHILNSAIAYFLLLILFFRKNGKYQDKAIAIISSFLIIVVLGVLWEGYQKSNDVLFGTHMFYDPRQPIRLDAATDIFFNMVGAFVAAIIANIYWNNIKEKLLK